MGDGHLSWSYYARLMYSALFFSLCLAISSGPTWAATIDFTGLAVGTKLDNQIAGVTFLKYSGVVGGVVTDTPSGHVASFNDNPGCEFCGSGARIAFSELQRSVTLHIGLLHIPGIAVQRDLRVTAFDAAGVTRGTAVANVIAGAGFDATLTVTIATPQIATIVLDAVINPETLATIAVHDITFDETTGGGPDFFLDGSLGATVVQGGAPIDIPLTILRIGGSTGDIGIALSPLPGGVTGSVLPNPASGNDVVLHLEATNGPVPETKMVVITGTPLTPNAGPAPRSLSLVLTTVPKLRVSGPADIDFAGCAPSGAHGTVSRDYWIIRDPSVSGPLNVAIEGLPADVTGTVGPQTLQFPGGAIGQRVSVSLTTIAGPTVPDTSVTLHLTGNGIDMPFAILLHGACPQQNRNFVIRGQFGYVNAQDVEPGRGFEPLKGAQVEIFRYRSDWHDDKVGEAYTDDKGRFSLDLYASRDGDYYARLRLFSPEVEVEDADNSSVWSIDTQHQSNRGGLIEVGSIQIWSDGGNGTPRAAVWQGFRNAALEFPNDFMETVPGGFFKVQIWRGHVVPLTWYDEVHWPHGYQTGENGNPYMNTKHEFGHVFRDVLDGPASHWHGDDMLYNYGREHGSCYIRTGTVANAGFAFHEGWAEYWSNDITCCPGDESNQDLEGPVAHDLNNLANKLSPDRNISRKEMLRVLQRGPNLIHSDAEFRREFAKEFPGVPLGSISDGCLPIRPRTAEDTGRYPELDPAEQRKTLVAAIAERQKAIAAFQEEERSSTGLRTFMLRAAVEEGTLVVQRMQDELVALDRGDPPERFLQRVPFEQLRRAEFVAQRKAIQIRALRDASAVVSAEQRPAVKRRIRLLQESRIEDASLESMLSLPAVAGDDTIAAPLHSPPWWLHWVTPVVVILIVALIILVLFVVQVRRGRRSSG